jgi:hypothetical protein
MPLPDLKDIPEGLSDGQVLEFILTCFREQQESAGSALEFTSCIGWILKLVMTRGEEKAMLLFRCGIILLNPYVAINYGLLSKTLSLPVEAVSRKVKPWPVADWDTEEKQGLLNLYEKGLEAKAWTVRKPPTDSVFFRFAVFRPMEQIPQRVPEVNEIPPAPYRPGKLLNIERIRSRRHCSEVIMSEAPKTWTFNEEPMVKLDIW